MAQPSSDCQTQGACLLFTLLRSTYDRYSLCAASYCAENIRKKEKGFSENKYGGYAAIHVFRKQSGAKNPVGKPPRYFARTTVRACI